MFDLPRSTSRIIAAAAVGVALVAGPAVGALNETPSRSLAEPACTGSESVVDGTPTCVPAPAAPDAPTAGIPAGPDSQEHDAGHH
ncbi:hypothetical protein [Mycolicibacterium holsaticum]|jgi:hypothetical protein|uniref:Intersectin-EH binding protein Ibp1 n=1 Tax=Mycolicibacterium holsaticum TaxID=152142 RepID=A0A1E3RJC8_9MYCO|nr:hypothetical protein [Mycolicibacterium holsaticum]ODQ89959.1 hypothetical protein BHQ17_17720 [Mycolicibacterium holsaticum]QZA12234.1 hypothetical protein K3U96_24380 [Mycolicibacterium holsaticum DSM 44478 = JCM 12374]UNC10280.1 hypothetical protein H5U41_02420 [Mycolicibacterium holsaticum DSM 44478 = JCM 12374]